MIDRAPPVARDGSSRGVRRDLRFGVRTVRRRPGFWLALVLALTLGIGASTAGVELARSGRLHTAPVVSPDGLPIPPTQVELVGEPGEPTRLAHSPIEGGALAAFSPAALTSLGAPLVAGRDFTTAALFASYLPARAAARVDPVVALAHD